MRRAPFLFLFTWLALNAAAQTPFALRSGDTVVFYGDSITDQRLYTTFVETYVVTRFPDRPIRFIHSGWGGDRVTGGGGGTVDVRLRRDVITYQPTVMTIMLGMNDAAYKPMEEARFKTYQTGYEHILDVVKTALPNLRLTLIQPSPYDDVTREPKFEGGYNAVLRQYSDYLKQLAQTRSATVADLNTPVVAMLTRANQTDSVLAQKIIPDRVHPEPSGHLIMAEALLQAWNAPAAVTTVVLDAAAQPSIVTATNTTVSALTGGDTLRWTQLDRALPMPVNLQDPAMALAVRSSDFIAALDQQTLKATGLPANRYTLTIDGQPAGTFSREEWSQGVNLATLPTPMAKQAAGVHALTLKHTGIHQIRWRSLQVPLADDQPAHLSAALEQLDALEADLIAQQRHLAQPVTHQFELRPELP